MSASPHDSAPERKPATPARGGPDASEFLSESSEEYRALRRGRVAEEPKLAPAEPQGPAGRRPMLVVPSVPSSLPEPASIGGGTGEAPPFLQKRPEPVRIAARPVTAVAAPRVDPPRRAVPWSWLVVTVALAVGATAWPLVRGTPPPAGTSSGPVIPSVGAATIMSRPSGAEVWIGGVKRGVTPLQLNLPAGTHGVEIRNGLVSRTLSLVITPNVAVRETVDLPPGAALGTLDISSDVPGTQVSIDGVPRGVTPLVLAGVAPGEHAVTLVAGATTVNRSVRVAAGGTASVMVSMGPGGSAGGFLSVQAPFEMQVWERGRIVGTTSAERLMLPAGARQLELVAEAYEFRTTVPTTIRPGRTTTIPVSVPNGRLSINAVPWADVWLDGVSLGATPLANVAVAIGPHEVMWRHPTLGEERQTVRVGTTTPARASVTFPSGR